MQEYNPFRWFYILFIISFLFSTCTDGKGFGGGRGGGGFGGGRGGGGFGGGKGGGKGGGSFGGSRGAGSFGGSSNNIRGSNYGGYNSMGKPRSGSSFKKNAMAFGAGALGGVAAYSLMRSMSHSYHPGSYRYEAGYGGGETCINNQDMNGTRYGSFRCPLNGFPYEAKYCCGDPENQYCCIRENPSSFNRTGFSFGGIFLFLLICIVITLIIVRCHRQRQKDLVMVPLEPPPNEPQGPPFYQPPPPPMGYPPPPMGYPSPPSGNPYAPPPQNYDGSYNPYLPQQQMGYPPQQAPYYPVKEGAPPAYNDFAYKN